MIYNRNCPKCGEAIEYKNPRSFKWADRDKKPCRKCYSKEISKTIKKQYDSGNHNFVTRNREREKTLDKKFSRNCPNCKTEMKYSRKDILNAAIKRNTLCNSCSTKIHKKGLINGVSEQQILQMRATKAGFNNWDDYVANYPKKQFYKREVWKHTYKNDLTVLPNWDKRGRCGVVGAYQLDHIVSINTGWEQGISPEEISKMDNLRMITWEENRKKGKS